MFRFFILFFIFLPSKKTGVVDFKFYKKKFKVLTIKGGFFGLMSFNDMSLDGFSISSDYALNKLNNKFKFFKYAIVTDLKIGKDHASIFIVIKFIKKSFAFFIGPMFNSIGAPKVCCGVGYYYKDYEVSTAFGDLVKLKYIDKSSGHASVQTDGVYKVSKETQVFSMTSKASQTLAVDCLSIKVQVDKVKDDKVKETTRVILVNVGYKYKKELYDALRDTKLYNFYEEKIEDVLCRRLSLHSFLNDTSSIFIYIANSIQNFEVQSDKLKGKGFARNIGGYCCKLNNIFHDSCALKNSIDMKAFLFDAYKNMYAMAKVIEDAFSTSYVLSELELSNYIEDFSGQVSYKDLDFLTFCIYTDMLCLLFSLYKCKGVSHEKLLEEIKLLIYYTSGNSISHNLY